MLSSDSLRSRIRNQQTVFGAFIELPCPEAVEIAALAGWDFVLVDSEHGAITPAAYPAFVRAGECRGLPVVFRVAENNAALIQQALDAGAAGVQVPQIGSLEAAEQAISAARYHPGGQRGFNPFVRAAGYSATPVPEFLDQSRQDVLTVLQLESAAAFKDIDRIAAVSGLDVLFIGPWDLSQSLGLPGETKHPAVHSEIERAIRVACAHGVAAGVFTSDPSDARSWASSGMRYVCCLVDTVVLLRGLRDLLHAIRR
jgi:4-hydroxy-2-oxoheptanedioate aldolase